MRRRSWNPRRSAYRVGIGACLYVFMDAADRPDRVREIRRAKRAHRAIVAREIEAGIEEYNNNTPDPVVTPIIYYKRRNNA